MDARGEDHQEQEKRLVVHQGEYFDKTGQRERNKRTFHQAMSLYLKHNSIYRRGHVEFLYAALDRMKEFEVHRDLDTYKQLLTLFPEGKMIARGPWEVEWMYYPKQQQCCIDIMDMMETHGELHFLSMWFEFQLPELQYEFPVLEHVYEKSDAVRITVPTLGTRTTVICY